jgi:CO/xanthine dehydrogenase Mo-binding subunit
MGLGLALSEQFEMEGGQVLSRYGTLGLLRADQVPPIEVKLVEKGDPAGLAYGAKGVGEISAIPTAPAVALAAMRVDGVERRSLPISGSPYRRGRAGTVAGRSSEPTMGAAREKERT